VLIPRQLLILFFIVAPLRADEAKLAVAANFQPTLRQLADAYEKESDHRFTLIPGSSGKLFAQIRFGAPFDAFFSADEEKPAKLTQERKPSDSKPRIYAHGQLALWIPNSPITENFSVAEYIHSANTRRIAIANPKLAPYGHAAIRFLESQGLLQAARPKLIYGENVAQAAHFVSSGTVDAALIAYSTVLSDPSNDPTRIWLPPQRSYPPIRQSALILTDNSAAKGLFAFLDSEVAQRIIKAAGYQSAR